ncbi:hypothetical protein Bca4012_051026 [Brassica carinata]
MLTTKIKIYFRYLDVSNRSENTCLIDTMGVVFNTESHFDDPASPKMVFYIRDNIESRIKCVATGDHAYAFRDGFENMRGLKCLLNSFMKVILVLLSYGLRPRVDYLISGSILIFRRLRSSYNQSITVTLIFGGTGL